MFVMLLILPESSSVVISQGLVAGGCLAVTQDIVWDLTKHGHCRVITFIGVVGGGWVACEILLSSPGTGVIPIPISHFPGPSPSPLTISFV